MATVTDALSFARTQAQTDSNGLTNANGIIFANEALFDFHRQLAKRGVDASQLQESYCDGTVPSSGNGSTFAYPTNMLALKTIELNYVNTNATDYKLAQQLDVSNLPNGKSFSWFRVNASRDYPHFDDRGDWYEVFPAFTSSDNLSRAIRLFYFLKPTEYASVSDSIAYPESLDYRILGWRIASSYLYSLGKMEEGAAFEQMYQKKVDEYVTTLARGSQQPIQAQEITWNGWEF